MTTSPRAVSERAARERERVELLAPSALAGDREAFEELVWKLQGPAWALARRIVMDREVAQEMVQEAFLEVHRHRAGFHAARGFLPWFYRILTNRCLNAVRRRRYQEALAEPTAFERIPMPAEREPQLVVEERSKDAALALAFDRMPVRYRAALAMRVHTGLRVDEVAAILGCPEGTVKTLLFRAREVLRAVASRWEEGE